MSDQSSIRSPRSKSYWAGWVLSGMVIAFLVMDFTIKLMGLPVVLSTTGGLGYPATAEFALRLGILQLVCTALYVAPRTAVLGAILLTGYLGGAVATHVRVGSPLFSHVLFGVYLGLMVWGGLYLRDPRIRALIPLRVA